MQNQIRLQAAPPDRNTRNKRELICTGVYRAPSTPKRLYSADVLKHRETAVQGARRVTYIQLIAGEARDPRTLPTSDVEQGVVFFLHKRTIVQAELD